MAKFFENKDYSLMCPNCNKFLVMVDKNDDRENIIKCKHCRKLITYIPLTGYRKVGKVPQMDSSSGKRFY